MCELRMCMHELFYNLLKSSHSKMHHYFQVKLRIVARAHIYEIAHLHCWFYVSDVTIIIPYGFTMEYVPAQNYIISRSERIQDIDLDYLMIQFCICKVWHVRFVINLHLLHIFRTIEVIISRLWDSIEVNCSITLTHILLLPVFLPLNKWK
jgi:hypothetical protein